MSLFNKRDSTILIKEVNKESGYAMAYFMTGITVMNMSSLITFLVLTHENITNHLGHRVDLSDLKLNVSVPVGTQICLRKFYPLPQSSIPSTNIIKTGLPHFTQSSIRTTSNRTTT